MMVNRQNGRAWRGGLVSEPISAHEVNRQLRGLRAIERVRDVVDDRFELEVRQAVCSGAPYPLDRLRARLTGLGERREPRVRLLFELFERGALDLHALADAPAACFFLGATARYHRSLDDWLRLLRRVEGAGRRPGGPPAPPATHDAELWTAGDLLWSPAPTQVRAHADYLTILLGRRVGVWRARTADHLPRLAVDRWSPGSSRVVIDPAVLDLTDAEPVVTGEAVDRRAPLLPRPRHVVER